MQDLHRRLCEQNNFYNTWHNIPGVSIVHFLVLITVASSLALAVQQAIVSESQVAAVVVSRSIPQLTTEIFSLTKRYVNAPPEVQSRLVEDLTALVLERKDMLAPLAQSDPHAFLRMALPESVRVQLPESVQALLEREVDAEGELTVKHQDAPPEGGPEYTLFELDTVTPQGPKHYRIRYADEMPSLVTGTKVHVRGVALDDELVAAAGGSGTTVVAEASTGPAGPQKTLVILFNFSDKATQPWTPAQIAQTIFTNSNSTNLYYQDTSFGAVSLEGDVVGWYTIPYTATGCSYTTWSSAAEQAAVAAGVPVSNYPHRIYIWNTSGGCSWGGMGTIGGNPTKSWIPGYNNPTIVAHEFGHNLGAQHAQYLNCGTKQIDTYTNCTISEYGDPSDVMGYNWTHYFHFIGARKIGEAWLSATSNLQAVTTSGTYTLTAGETNDTSIKVLKIPKPNTGDAYYVSYRQPVGSFDATIPSPFSSGASIHIWNGNISSQTKLIDTTPDGNASNAPLADGRSFTDSVNGITVTQISHSASGVVVDVQLAGAVCSRVAPTVTLSPATQSGVIGQTLTYVLSVKNNDTSACVGTTFALASTVPGGWNSSSLSLLTLAPGASGSTNLSVTPAGGTVDGSYTISAQANDSTIPNHSASAPATYVVFTPATDSAAPTVIITSPTNGTKLKGGGNVNVSVSASDVSGISSIIISVDGAKVKTCTSTTSCSYNWSGKSISKGTHSITSVATDASLAKNQATSSVTITK